MDLKKKTGFLMFLCGMVTIAAVAWYCILSVNRSNTPMDGTFVSLPRMKNEKFVLIPPVKSEMGESYGRTIA